MERKAHHPRGATFAYKNEFIVNENQNILKNRIGADALKSAQNGITLISLIITIIILLILAGVTISLTLGEGGIFGLTSQSVEKQKMAEYEEKIELSRSKALASKEGTITIEDLINQIYEDKIVQEGTMYVGGIVGMSETNALGPGHAQNNSGNVIRMYNLGNNGEIIGKENIGGTAGYIMGFRGSIYFYNSFNTGECIGERFTGGCVGSVHSSDGWGGNSGNVFVGNLYNAGDIQNVTEVETIGGIYGDASCQYVINTTKMKIENCYSLNKPIGTKYGKMASGFSKGTITENNIATKTQKELKSQEFINMLNEQKEKDKTTYNLELKKWVQGNEQTKGYPKFEN